MTIFETNTVNTNCSDQRNCRLVTGSPKPTCYTPEPSSRRLPWLGKQRAVIKFTERVTMRSCWTTVMIHMIQSFQPWCVQSCTQNFSILKLEDCEYHFSTYICNVHRLGSVCIHLSTHPRQSHSEPSCKANHSGKQCQSIGKTYASEEIFLKWSVGKFKASCVVVHRPWCHAASQMWKRFGGRVFTWRVHESQRHLQATMD